jgi:hypothetical protein
VTISLRIGVCIVAASMLWAAPAASQARFRTTYQVKARDANGIVLEGQVVNDTGRDVFDVWVTAEGLSPSSKVLTTGITFVTPTMARNATAMFEAKIPTVEGIEKFRVTVTSYRAGAAPAQPSREVQSP